MSFWSTERLLQKHRLDKLIDPFDPQCVKQGAYELSFCSEAFISTELKGTKQTLVTGEQIVIPPGQFGLLLTEEVVHVPNHAIGFISIRFSIKLRGLVNVSGFHVDPGFNGRLKFAVYNAGSQNIILTCGDRVFIIWFSDLSGPTRDVYDGDHAGQTVITSEDVMQLQGEVASPAELKRKIDELKREFEQRFTSLDDKITIWRTVTITLLSGLFVAVIVGMIFLALRIYAERPAAPSNQPAQSTRSQEPTQDLKQREPAANQKTENSANTPNNTSAIKPEPTK